MIKVLFLCHGNICRSPMAEFVFKDMVEKAGLPENLKLLQRRRAGRRLAIRYIRGPGESWSRWGSAPAGSMLFRQGKKIMRSMII